MIETLIDNIKTVSCDKCRGSIDDHAVDCPTQSPQTLNRLAPDTIDYFEEQAKRDDWHTRFSGSDIRMLIGEIRSLQKAQSSEISLQQHLDGLKAAEEGYEAHNEYPYSKEALHEAVCHYNEFVWRIPKREYGRDDSGWLIELGASSTASPQYWAGSSLWVSDHMKALRFARREDATQAAQFMLDGINVRICEHGWSS